MNSDIGTDMKVELPNFQRCCCCMPLRQGILMFAYLSLVITIFFGVLQTRWGYVSDYMAYPSDMTVMYRGLLIRAHMVFVSILYVLDVIFNIVLIVGAHMKNNTMIRCYYYYQLTMMVANFFAMIVNYYTTLSKANTWGYLYHLTDVTVAFVALVIQIYLLLLVRSELGKERYQEGRSSYVNKVAEVFIEPPQRHDRRTLL